MKLARFTAPGHPEPLAGMVEGEEVVAFGPGDAIRTALAGDVTATNTERFALADVELLAPIGDPGTIYAIGLNYAKHVEETGGQIPEVPVVFVKVRGSLAPPAGPIICPEVVRRLDYEGELVLVMGSQGELAGYCIADDVTGRDLQRREPNWIRGKGADTFCPLGPWITTSDEVPDAANLRLRTWVNGELRQDSNTSDLIFKPRELVDFISQTCSLLPGDLILTGTPSGVGMGMDPPQFLKSGDVVRIEIERLGVIEHPVG